jgi:hypothetical protein
VYRGYGWRCWSCRWWNTHYPLGDCQYCRRRTRIGEQNACRLCLEQARMLQEPGRAADVAAANRHGQQLFFANTQVHRPKTPRLTPDPERARDRRFQPGAWRQGTLLDLEPDPELIKQLALAADDPLIRHCKDVVRDHARTYGWSVRQTNDVIRSLRLLQVLQETPEAKINATDVLQLPRYDANVNSTLEVLRAAGLLIDDRPSHTRRYFAGKTDTLPAPMRAQLDTWLEVLLAGSTTAPRQRARDPQTIRIQILGITPILHAWADAGHHSLAEITADDIRTALPPSGARRNFAEYGLRSLFKILKARKVIFINPTRGMKVTPIAGTVPLPLDTDAIKAALDSPDPATALAVALVAFHALTTKQVANLTLTDIIDGRLNLNRRSIPLADPVRVRLTAWLDHRARTWPRTINPHLFITRKSAPRLVPVGSQFPWRNTTLRPQALREDRILQEIHATGGDIRRICDLFDLTVDGALRYAATLNHPGITAKPTGSGTHDPA